MTLSTIHLTLFRRNDFCRNGGRRSGGMLCFIYTGVYFVRASPTSFPKKKDSKYDAASISAKRNCPPLLTCSLITIWLLFYSAFFFFAWHHWNYTVF